MNRTGYRLLVHFPSGRRRAFRWSRPVCRIGRSVEADLQLRDEWAGDSSVSRKHASIIFSDGQYRIVDNESTNGVFVNGRRVRDCWLTNGDEIAIGNFRLRFEICQGGAIDLRRPLAYSAALGKIELLDTVHQGEFSRIYKARVANDGSVVAVKVAVGSNEWAVTRLRTEWDSLSRLTSRYRLPPLAKAKVGTMPAIVYPWLPGGSLKECIRRRDAMPPSLLSRALWPVASLLYELHSCGLVHNDVKPSNVLLDDRGNGFLIDFGAVTGVIVTAKQPIGSPVYMAPERLRAGASSPASDVFSLGCTLYECITGRAPTTAPSTDTIHHQMTDSSWGRDMFERVPPEIGDLLRRMLAADPGDRPSTEDVLHYFSLEGERSIWKHMA